MSSVVMQQQVNPGGTTLTYTIKCDLGVVSDVYGNLVENPIRTLAWKEDEQTYVLVDDDDDDDEPEESTTPTGIGDDIGDIADLPADLLMIQDTGEGVEDNDDNDVSSSSSSTKTILARECWCARIFQQELQNSGSPPSTMPPLFCPLDTNGDGALTTRRDVRKCTAQAVFDLNGTPLGKANANSKHDDEIKGGGGGGGGYRSVCYSEEPLAEFTKSAWPLCFFWWMLLVYVWCATNYGRRVRGFLWRMTALQSGGLRKAVRRRIRRHRHRHHPTGSSILDEEQGGITETTSPPTTVTTITSTHPNNTLANSPNRREDTTSDGELSHSQSHSQSPSIRSDEEEPSSLRLATIERDFGSYENYALLEYELRYQAARTGSGNHGSTNNEFVTWLWYSAVYTEVRRYRCERRRERRERRWRRRHTGAHDHFEPESDDDDDGEGNLLYSRRLDSIYWWPPAGPDGRRWHVTQQQQRRENNETAEGRDSSNTNDDVDIDVDDENNNTPIDSTRLFLKTRQFSMLEEASFPNQTKPMTTELAIDSIGGAAVLELGNDDDDVLVGDDDGAVANDDDENENENDDDIPDNTCSICLCELEEGDWVGDISCGHVFHKDCIKGWLVKNNHCPVCRKPGIASHPRREERHQQRATTVRSV